MSEGATGSAETSGEGQSFAGGLARNAEEAVACVALVIVVLSVSWAVITRYITATPATWAGEVSAAAFSWLVFIGAAAGFKRGLHVSIDMLVEALPRALRNLVLTIVDALIIAFCVYVTWLAWGFMNDNWDNPSPALRMPQAVHYMSATVGFALMTLRYVMAAQRRWRMAGR